jgi:hypothetical protein
MHPRAEVLTLIQLSINPMLCAYRLYHSMSSQHVFPGEVSCIFIVINRQQDIDVESPFKNFVMNAGYVKCIARITYFCTSIAMTKLMDDIIVSCSQQTDLTKAAHQSIGRYLSPDK